MKVTTWVKRRQSAVQAVTQVKRLSLVRNLIRRPTGSNVLEAFDIKFASVVSG